MATNQRSRRSPTGPEIMSVERLLLAADSLKANGISEKDPRYQNYFRSLYSKHGEKPLPGETKDLYSGTRVRARTEQELQNKIDKLAHVVTDLRGAFVDRQVEAAVSWMPSVICSPEDFHLTDRARQWLRTQEAEELLDDFWSFVLTCISMHDAACYQKPTMKRARPTPIEAVYASLFTLADTPIRISEYGEGLNTILVEGAIRTRPNGWPVGHGFGAVNDRAVRDGWIQGELADPEASDDLMRQRTLRGLAKGIIMARWSILYEIGMAPEFLEFFRATYKGVQSEVAERLRKHRYSPHA